jgi:hypothetical protein
MNLAEAPKSVKRFCAGAKKGQKPAKTATFMGVGGTRGLW